MTNGDKDGRTALFMGLCGLDVIYDVDALPAENDKCRTTSYRTAPGGPATNAAITFALLGGRPLLVTCIGCSETGRALKGRLEELGVRTIDLAGDSPAPPDISCVLLHGGNGSRTIVSGQNRQRGSLPDADRLDDLCRCTAFCLYDCNLGSLVHPILERLSARGRDIVLDAGSWKEDMDLVFRLATDVIASEKLAGRFCSLEEMGRNWPSVRNLAVTRGGNPISIYGKASIPVSRPEKVADTLGAGDVLHGAFCHYHYTAGLEFEEALRRASLTASHKVGVRGVAEGVRSFIRQQRTERGRSPIQDRTEQGTEMEPIETGRAEAAASGRKVVYVDMDNVLVDFRSGIDSLDEGTRQAYAGRLDEVPHIFGRMDPLPGAVEAFRRLAGKYDVYILSTAPWENPSAWSEKLEWVKRHLGAPAYKRLILTHHKDLNRGDYLIDDRKKNGAGAFAGELILFGSDRFPDWKAVMDYLD